MDYKKEYEKEKTKLEILEAIGLAMFYAVIIIIKIIT